MRPVGLGLKKGAWTAEEDMLLKNYIEEYGEGKWHRIPLKAGLNRCRKSCRLRWLNYLRPDIKRGDFGEDEVDLILRLHKLLGNRWSLIAGRIPGRTANDVKNYWNSHLQSRPKQKKEPKDDGLLQETRVTIIKPQPLTFFKKVNSCIGGDPCNLAREGGSLINSSNDGANNFNMSSIISSPDVLDNNINEYLDDIDKEFGMSFDFSVGGETLNVVEQEDDHKSMFDFPLDDIDFMWHITDSSEQ